MDQPGSELIDASTSASQGKVFLLRVAAKKPIIAPVVVAAAILCYMDQTLVCIHTNNTQIYTARRPFSLLFHVLLSSQNPIQAAVHAQSIRALRSPNTVVD